MESAIKDAQKILREFRTRWPLSNVKQMSLDKYVGVHNKDTFCYWVEMKTISLGSIRGYPSNKFGIYKRTDSSRLPLSGDFSYDEEFTWRTKFGNNRNDAFSSVKALVLQTVNY